MNTKQTRLTILGGFLGSGKTTVLRTLLKNLDPHIRTAVIINDFGDVNIDSLILSCGNYSKKEITGGCICCSLKEKLLDSLLSIIKDEEPDEIFIEATGLAVPREMKETIEKNFSAEQVLVNQVLVCVDALQYSRFHGLLPVYRRQLEGNPHILITKCDLHPQEILGDVSESIRKHYPRISSLRFMEKGELDLTSLPVRAGEILNSGKVIMPGLLSGGRNFSHKDNIIELSFSGRFTKSSPEMEQAVMIRGSRIIRLKGFVSAGKGGDFFINFDGENFFFENSRELSEGKSHMTLFCLEQFRDELERKFQDYFD